jgi:hypothetical protein
VYDAALAASWKSRDGETWTVMTKSGNRVALVAGCRRQTDEWRATRPLGGRKLESQVKSSQVKSRNASRSSEEWQIR